MSETEVRKSTSHICSLLAANVDILKNGRLSIQVENVTTLKKNIMFSFKLEVSSFFSLTSHERDDVERWAWRRHRQEATGATTHINGMPGLQVRFCGMQSRSCHVKCYVCSGVHTALRQSK